MPTAESVDAASGESRRVDDSVYFLGTLTPVSTTIRVSQGTRDRFAKLADATGRPMTQLVDEAVDALERRVFFDQLTVGYERASRRRKRLGRGRTRAQH